MKLNLLIRTSSRPKQFKRCLNSVRNQSHKDIDLHVSADNLKTIAYVKNEGLNSISVSKTSSLTHTAPYNLYLNNLMQCVSDGWVMFLDDDDMLIDKNTVKRICDQLKNEDTLYIFRMQWPDGRIIPSDFNHKSKNIECRDIGMPNFVFHYKHIGKTWFEPYKTGDYRFIEQFQHHFNSVEFVDIITVQTGNSGAKGEPENDGSVTVVIENIDGNESLLRYTLRSVEEFIPDIQNIVLKDYNAFWLKNTISTVPSYADNVIRIDCGCIMFSADAKRFYKAKEDTTHRLLKEINGKKGVRFNTSTAACIVLKNLFSNVSSYEADTSSFAEMYNIYKATNDFEVGVCIIKDFTKNRSLYRACVNKGDNPVMRKKLDVSLKLIARRYKYN